MTSAIDLGVVAESSGFQHRETIEAWPRYKIPRPINYDNLGKHYADWSFYAKQLDLFPTEYLVPRLIVPFDSGLPEAMRLSDSAFKLRPALRPEPNPSQWGYYFVLGGGQSTLGRDDELTPLLRPSRFRSLHRLRVLGKACAALFGGSLDGVSVLDMACNWGAFALEMRARGAGPVRAFDLQQGNIAKAVSLARYLGLTDVEYMVMNAYDVSPPPKYDLVLNLGLLYHVTKQWELVRKTYDLCNKVAVIETVTHKMPFSGFTLGWYNGPEHAGGEERTRLCPTYRGLIDMMLMVGFRQVFELDGDPDPEWTDYAADPFGSKHRRFMVGVK